jgi:colicin import membrane protein
MDKGADRRMRKQRPHTDRVWTSRTHITVFAALTITAGSIAAWAAPQMSETARPAAAPEVGKVYSVEHFRLAQADAEPEKSLGERASEFFDSILNQAGELADRATPTRDGETEPGQAPGVVERAQDMLSGARKSYTEEVVPRLKAGGGFDAPARARQRAAETEQPASENPTPGGGLSAPSGQSFIDGVRGLIERAMRGYQGEIVPRLSGGVPATAVTEAERRRAEEAARRADQEAPAARGTDGDADASRRAREAAERERELRAEIRRREQAEAEARRRAAVERSRAEAERERQARLAAARERAEQLERERQARTTADREQADSERQRAEQEARDRAERERREAEAERERQAAKARAEADLRATQRDAERARAEAERNRQAAERENTTQPDPVAALKARREGDWDALLERASAASRELEGIVTDTEAELGRRLSAFERLLGLRRDAQSDVDTARRALSQAIGDEARAQAGTRSDRAEARLEAVRTAYGRRRQNTEAYQQTATSIRAERRRMQSAVGLAQEAYNRLTETGSTTTVAAVEREDLRLRRGVSRAEAALDRARRAAERAPAEITDTISPVSVPERVARTPRTEPSAGASTRTPDLPVRPVSRPSDRNRIAQRTGRRDVSRPTPTPRDSSREAVGGSRQFTSREVERPAARDQDRVRDRVAPQQRTAASTVTSRSRSADRPNARRSRPRRVAGHRRRVHRKRTARVSARRHRHYRCYRAGRLVRRGRKYVVRRGDSLWRIARRHYGRGSKFRRIYRANRRKIRNPDLIFPCQRFRVPGR